MTSALALRRAAIRSLALTVLLIVLTPDGSRAEGPAVTSVDTLAREAYPAASSTTGSGQTGQNDETVETTLVENAWDFINPDSIPGFASTPYPVLSNPEIAD